MGEAFLHGVEVVNVDDGARSIQTVASSVIGLVGTAPKGPVNTPVLILGSATDAVKQFGAGVGTIPDALDAIFDQAGAAVVVINVLDPTTHKTAVASASYTFSDDDEVTLADRYASNVVVKDETDTTTFVAGTDYSFDPDTGVVTRIAAGGIAADATVHVSYDKPDPTAVTSADIVGGVDAETGAYTGVHALLSAQGTVKVKPKILIAPGYTGDRTGDAANPVVAEMSGIADKLLAVIVADGPNTTDADAITYREDWGSERIFVVDPESKVYDTASGSNIDMPSSARVAGLIAKVDAKEGFWVSPSNHVLNGIVGTSRPIDFSLGDANSRANYLNANEVATIIGQDGYRLWGNRTCAADAKWAFLSVVRTRDMINESLLSAHMWAVDRNITKNYVEEVIEGVNAYLRNLVGKGAILGGKCWADPELNSADQIAAGHCYFDFDFTPPSPAERVTFRSHMVNDYIKEVF